MENGKHVILVIDDNKDFLKALVLLLEANGYAVHQAGSAKEGIKAYKKTNPDLILVDLMMEEIDAGSNFAKELKTLNNKAPVYLISSTGEIMSQAIDTVGLGFSGVIQKPYDKDELLSLLKTKLT
ncbi:hypothetical protein BVX98_07160 [bacterium F11]|nr:hypothetical protein BVX98_07160 [bacterium F11]